ncbi:uncharacterized protein DUF4037 [Melghirimyces profundicolus]|uniref:Uncharacterized protein DUF4037 n=1 Tax=Melghirimyces profundicolus TaxID=1242148 RepID=A0A2T6BXB0_9BACL|nr:nucleotidyltransferase-like protein [Melghirimyces profundicolus]PTX60693.1 uncharacterized protein DUF4037 [Melghirimyces profundicolus]
MIQTLYPKLIQQLNENRHAAGAMVLSADRKPPVVSGPADLLVLVVTGNPEFSGWNLTYMAGVWKVKELWVGLEELTAEVVNGDRQEVIDCLLDGEVLYDPRQTLRDLCDHLRRFPNELRRKKMCVEFSGLLRGHSESKYYMKEKDVLDAFCSLQKSLQHWVRLALIEKGQYPRGQLWSQVKTISPGIVKLMRELVRGEESMEQRIHLVLLAEEYAILNKLEFYCSYLLDLLSSEDGCWTLSQIHDRLRLERIRLDLSLIMEELVRRALVEEVIINGKGVAEQHYRLPSGRSLK